MKDYLEKASTCFANEELEFEPIAFRDMEEEIDALKNGEVDCVFPVNFSDYDGENRGVVITPSLTRAALCTVVRASDQKDFAQKEDITAAVIRGGMPTLIRS